MIYLICFLFFFDPLGKGELKGVIGSSLFAFLDLDLDLDPIKSDHSFREYHYISLHTFQYAMNILKQVF